jgi:hypothetical protein
VRAHSSEVWLIDSGEVRWVVRLVVRAELVAGVVSVELLGNLVVVVGLSVGVGLSGQRGVHDGTVVLSLALTGLVDAVVVVTVVAVAVSARVRAVAIAVSATISAVVGSMTVVRALAISVAPGTAIVREGAIALAVVWASVAVWAPVTILFGLVVNSLVVFGLALSSLVAPVAVRSIDAVSTIRWVMTIAIVVMSSIGT